MICDDCKQEYDMVMVKDAVWQYATRYEHHKWELGYGGHPSYPHIFTYDINYCKECIEKRISRPLIQLDLMDCPANDMNPIARAIK